MGLFGPSIRKMKKMHDIDGLIDVLKHSVDYVQFAAAQALSEIEDVRAIEPLIEALKDSDSSVRSYVAEILRGMIVAGIKDVRAVEPLIAALKDSDRGVRWRAALALGWIKDVRAVEPLIKALKDSDGEVRESAKIALEKLGIFDPVR